MSDNALSQISPSSSQSAASALTQRVNEAFAHVAKNPSAAFKKAKENGQDYALIGTGIMVFSVPANRVEDSMPSRSFLGRVELDPLLVLDVAPQDIRYGAQVLESGIFGRTQAGQLVNPHYSLNADREKIDLCDVFFACTTGVAEFYSLASVAAHEAKLSKQNLKAYVALAAHVPDQHSPRPYAAELVLAVCRDNAEELPLFNLGTELLRPSHYSGRGTAPSGKPMGKKALYIKGSCLTTSGAAPA